MKNLCRIQLFWGLVFVGILAPPTGSTVLMAQVKYEKEVRILRADFPQKDLIQIDSLLQHAKRIHYYKESDGDNISFEVKFKFEGYRYSIEFDADGTLEDIEITIAPLEMAAEVLSSIDLQFERDFEKFKRYKTQVQYPHISGISSKQVLQDAIQQKATNYRNFEVLVSGKTKEKQFESFQYLFDHRGKFIERILLHPLSDEHLTL
ncbi:MAG: hypothetical protein ACON42_07405 [Flavobacteriaceae bacterium]